MSFAKNMTKDNQKRDYHADCLSCRSATNALKTTAKKVIKKAAEATTGDLIGNKISDKITKFLKPHQRIVQEQLQRNKKYWTCERCSKRKIYICRNLLMM